MVLLSLFLSYWFRGYDLVVLFPLEAVMCIAWGTFLFFCGPRVCSSLVLEGWSSPFSFSLWTVASVFAFLEDSCWFPEKTLSSDHFQPYGVQYFAGYDSFASASFLKQKRRGTLITLLPSVTHKSVKHALLTFPSSSSLFLRPWFGTGWPYEGRFSHAIVVESFFQWQWDTDGLFCFPLGSVTWFFFHVSSSPSSSSYAKSSSQNSRDSNRPASSSSLPLHVSKVAFKKSLGSHRLKSFRMW